MLRLPLLSLLFVGLITPDLMAENNEESLDSLLNDFRVVSDLSNQTKKEAAGSMIVYTRSDLERMQAYNLRDVLKTIPIYTMQETATGPVSLSPATGSTFNSQYIKFYINDHELGSPVYGSAMKVWGYMDISHIDHIEVYQVGSSVVAGDEPPGMVIRLYTKDPKRENGAQIQAVGSSSGSLHYNGYYAGNYDDLSYLVYYGRNVEQRDAYQSGSSKIDRDFESHNFFTSLSGENFQVDVGVLQHDQSGLFGLGIKKEPTDNYLDLRHLYFNYTQYLQEKSIKVKVSYDQGKHLRYDEDPSKIQLNDGTKVSSWFYDKREKVIDFSVTKNINTQNNDFQVGTQIKRKSYDVASLLIDGVERKDDASDYNQLDIYSLFMQDDYSINENNLLAMTLKYDYHKHNAVVDDTKNYVARLGYIHNNDKWMWKTFLIHTYGYPVFIQNSYFPFVFTQNTNLENEDRYAGVTELHYKTQKSHSSIRMMHTAVDKQIFLNQKKEYTNKGKRVRLSGIYISHEYNFDLRNKISISAYAAENNQPYDKSSAHGAMMQLFNTWGDFDLYNELIYKVGYDYDVKPTTSVSVDDGYDYTVALAYHPTKDLTLSLKGENLLDKAIETAYAIPARQTVEYIAPFDRVIRFGLKYVF